MSWSVFVTPGILPLYAAGRPALSDNDKEVWQCVEGVVRLRELLDEEREDGQRQKLATEKLQEPTLQTRP